MKQKILSLLLCVVLVASLAACTSTSPENSKEVRATTPPPEESELVGSEDPSEAPTETSGAVQSGTYTLPCGMTLQFFSSVRNDVTGNWRRATTSDSYAPADCALEYYNEMFSSDDEIHSIWNATLGTTTRIMVSGNILFVDTLKYVNGEEHDAKVMFSGDVLDSMMIDKETGESVGYQ